MVEISKSSDTIIQDRTIFEDAKIFAPNLHEMGMMSDRDFENYTDLFDLMISLVKLPDLMIYIKSTIPNLVSQIQKRGREFEKSIRIDYLQGLNNRYEEWISNYKGPLMVIDGDTWQQPTRLPADYRYDRRTTIRSFPFGKQYLIVIIYIRLKPSEYTPRAFYNGVDL